MPILRQVTQVEYALLLQKMPPEKVQEHLQSDRVFIDDLIRRCQAAGILITAGGEQIAGLMNAIFFVSLHEEDFGPVTYPGTLNILLDLIAAYCVGEVVVTEEAQRQPGAGQPPG